MYLFAFWLRPAYEMQTLAGGKIAFERLVFYSFFLCRCQHSKYAAHGNRTVVFPPDFPPFPAPSINMRLVFSISPQLSTLPEMCIVYLFGVIYGTMYLRTPGRLQFFAFQLPFHCELTSLWQRQRHRRG